ncbi:hypothetical protein B9Q11_02055 [Candidatus Marsarchaeota G2 archaeon ECH_B_SAG-F08]|uniref:YdbS-like PH domain-containing protein n=4 Tax=Candidatus Marsarchaeota TaxID=1978152 RepID=A0A2R6BJ14_9ARCH|nr:MAG: hypothetical protein B9Q11_02055 [Candidatus Marsarchaeota G2 archaeon ECH_B_SAG-F08]PSO05014.1 MAG: hypothetical protein B9Q13_03005 [Candidatus Marsarchaeota G2 archaeon ECH_B_SAG-G16]
MLAFRIAFKANKMEVLRPVIKKTLVKGVIAIAVLSLVLDVNNFFNYTIFLVVSLSMVVAYAFYKRASKYTIEDEAVVLKAPFRSAKRLRYDDIRDLGISQGVLAKMFNCGTVYLVLKHGKGAYTLVSGGSAEALKDVSDPKAVYEKISQRIEA